MKTLFIVIASEVHVLSEVEGKQSHAWSLRAMNLRFFYHWRRLLRPLPGARNDNTLYCYCERSVCPERSRRTAIPLHEFGFTIILETG